MNSYFKCQYLGQFSLRKQTHRQLVTLCWFAVAYELGVSFNDCVPKNDNLPRQANPTYDEPTLKLTSTYGIAFVLMLGILFFWPRG